MWSYLLSNIDPKTSNVKWYGKLLTFNTIHTCIIDDDILSRNFLLKSAASEPQIFLVVDVEHSTYSLKALQKKVNKLNSLIFIYGYIIPSTSSLSQQKIRYLVKISGFGSGFRKSGWQHTILNYF